MNVSAETLVWLFAIMGALRVAIILRKREVSYSQYKWWAKRIAFLIIWLLAIYGFIAYSKVKSVTEVLNDRYVWIVAEGGGFWLRKEPHENAEIVQDSIYNNLILVPTGKRVTVLERGLNPENIDGQSGAWCKIEYNGHQGYCFDAWLLSESEVIELVQSYISYLAEENKEKACALQTYWPDCEQFASPAHFGGIIETEIISSSFSSVAREGAAWVCVIYRAFDAKNEEYIKTINGLVCDKPGIVYEENFLVKRQLSGDFKIVSFNRLKLRCPD
ncbi:MAG: hypothetical protein ACKV1O_16030 [Saprospiraceae bacterium]